MSDCLLDWMKKHLPPERWTRTNYLKLAYWDEHVELHAEGESMLPEEFQLPENRSGWVGPFNQENVIAIDDRKAQHAANTEGRARNK